MKLNHLTGVIFIIYLLLFPANFRGRVECSVKTTVAPLHYNRGTVDALNREIAKSSAKPRYLSVLKGIRWCVIFCDDDKNFDFTFSNYITMLDELSLHKPESKLARIVHELILKEFDRALPKMASIFKADEDGYNDYTSLLPVVYHHKISIMPFKKFAESYFKGVAFHDRMKDFREAAEKHDYNNLTDLVVNAVFNNMCYRWKADRDFILPPDIYSKVIDECVGIQFINSARDDGYHYQNYYATHVLLALNHYGQIPYKPSVTGDRIFFYLMSQYNTVRYQVDDIDLLCEYLYCFRQFSFQNLYFIAEGENYVITQQREDGGWGPLNDPDDDPYDRLHPTWTAVTLLVLGV